MVADDGYKNQDPNNTSDGDDYEYRDKKVPENIDEKLNDLDGIAKTFYMLGLLGDITYDLVKNTRELINSKLGRKVVNNKKGGKEMGK